MFQDLLKADLRLSMLLLLREAGGTSSVNVLHFRVSELGHSVTRADVQTELKWLHDRGLVSGGNDLPMLTPRGLDLAGGPLPAAGDDGEDDGSGARFAAAA
jgi:hypothetical protein